MNYKFPKDFMWGVGSAAFQIEGAMEEDGKTLNIREASFYEEPRRETFADQRSPAVSTDFYHRYPEDIQRIGELGAKVFRYSIAWTRIIPKKDGKVNQKGIDYYNRVIDEMIKNGITPFMDLFHSDLPLWVVEEGGIIDDRFITWFADYAEVCFKAFGDRVKWWSTVNEPKLSVYGAYAFARMMPFVSDHVLAWKAVHNMNLAHFEAVRRLRKLWPDAKIGSVNNGGECYCKSFDPEDIAAAQRHVAMQLPFLDAQILGEYPRELTGHPNVKACIPDAFEQELKEKFQPMDFYGINYYCPNFIRKGKNSYYDTEAFQGDLQKDAYGFYNYASGMFDFVTMLADRYSNLPVIITENGFAQKRGPEEPQDLEPLRHDPARISYMCEHIRTCGRLLRAGVNLLGYFYWAITDTWEVAQGYTCPMGLVGVNFDTLERQKRDSFYYYQKIIRNNMVD